MHFLQLRQLLGLVPDSDSSDDIHFGVDQVPWNGHHGMVANV